MKAIDIAYALDKYTDAVNDLAWKMIINENIPYSYPVEPVYPLKWFLTFGKPPKEFIEKLLKVKPRIIARAITDNIDDDCMDIIRKVGQLINAEIEEKAD